MEEKTPIGYPEIDKPWLKYYVASPKYVGDLTSKTLYEAYMHANQDNLDSLAIVTMDGGFRYTHREIQNMVDLAAGGFATLGIGKNSKVGIMLNNTIEDNVMMLGS